MSFFTTSDGKRLFYTDTGPEGARPILCLAGLTRNSDDFSFVAPHLTDYRLIALDTRGRGQSEYDPDYMNYNVIRESHDAIELLDHLDLDRVTVLGTSRGGLIAMALAASHPERLRAVVLNDIGPVVGAAGIARIMNYVGKKPKAKTLEQAAVDMKAALEHEFPGVPLEVWRRQAAFQYQEVPGGLELRYDGAALHKALLEQGATGATPDMWIFFEALAKLPLAVIRGANSDILSHDTLEEMRRRHPGLIAAEVADRGHPPFLDEPEALAAIRALLEQTE
ncbi:alpha/beta fold hydrolase [Pseudodonghicola sp.]|uniref:alpha/beta fold hydrolase n=1 Tax=Pseudodonghicola sp. TaxID=1969463 RepID=UPI003A974A2C